MQSRSAITVAPPAESEYGEFYAGYIARIPPGSVIDRLDSQLRTVGDLFRAMGEDRAAHRYAAGKWTIRETIGHMTDTERVMAYRALRIARGDTTPLAGFDQDRFMEHAGFEARALGSVVEEFTTTREATLAMLRAFPEDAFERMGTASDHPVSVRALAYIIAGHADHHLEILRTHYGVVG